MNLDVGDPPAHERGTDAAQAHRADGRRDIVRPFGRVVLRCSGGGSKQAEGNNKQQSTASESVVHRGPQARGGMTVFLW